MVVSDTIRQYVKWFRHSASYINTHRGKTFVLTMGGEAVASDNFTNIVHDIALLNSLGVRLVLVFGSRPQIEARLREKGVETRLHHHLRVTDEAALVCVKEAVGCLRTEIEARLSMGLPNSPMHGARLRVCSGNFVIGKPLGVYDGVDLCHTGEVRKIDHQALQRVLAEGAIVLLSNLGYSRSGELFNLAVEDVATQTAIALKADKLLIFGKSKGIVDADGELYNQLIASEAAQMLRTLEAEMAGPAVPHPEVVRQLRAATGACQGGVGRCHLLSYQEDGCLLTELFTRDGAGTMVIKESYEQVRRANIEDVGGILELIRPLEEAGVLVRRSRELLESEIDRFTVVDLDGTIIGCAALYPFSDDLAGELACVAVHPDYRGGERGYELLTAIEKESARLGLTRLFVLTTRTAHWFLERGFVESSPEALPRAKQKLYNLQRNSKVFVKELQRGVTVP